MTDVKLVKDCGLYPSYKKIIDFTGTKSEIITKQINWINQYEHYDIFDANYNKFQNRLVLEIDYEEALTYTYCVLSNITGTENKPQFFFINDVENLTNGMEQEPSVAISLSLDPIMTFMGEWRIDECMVDREHVDRWGNTNKPIRVTPNVETTTAFAKLSKSIDILRKYNDTEYVYICVAFTSDKLYVPLHPVGSTPNPQDNLYYGVFPVCLSRDVVLYGVYIEGRETLVSTTANAYVLRYPSLYSVIDGTFMNDFEITPEDIVSISIIPVASWNLNVHNVNEPLEVNVGIIHTVNSIQISNPPTQVTEVVYIGDKPAINMDYLFTGLTTQDEGHDYRTVKTDSLMMQVFDGSDLVDSKTTSNILFSYPIKPTNNATNSPDYEPALFMSPYMERYITDGVGQEVLHISDNMFFDNSEDGNLEISYKQYMNGSNNSIMFYIGEEPSTAGILGNSGMMPNDNLFVVNDAWKTYNLTAKDSDRQMVTNYSIKNAIDNLIYMSYGGALVGSRSAGSEGYISREPTERNYVRDRGANGRFAGGHWEYSSSKAKLTDTGKRVIGAVGLAGASSIVTSLVDAHTAWANQMEKEKQIKNQPAGLLQSGTGQSKLIDKLPYPKAIETKVDDVAYNRAYENFRKYGYWVYKFEKPNIQSRKYYNYILTNGAIINGALNQTIRDVIASIFDAGVTIFHYDSGDTTTRRLEYTDKENIEVSLT